MADLIVHGGRRLTGRIVPSANKNAVLPILCATLLSEEPIVLHGVPDITDARKILAFFETLGSDVDFDVASGRLRLHHGPGLDASAAHLPSGMRSSVMLVPGLVHRFGRVTIEDDVKGCSLGSREIDPHIEVFQTFGMEVHSEPGALVVSRKGRLTPARHWLDYASVTTTENFVLCAAMAGGRSELTNAASEPHVQEFCAFMTMLGARIEGHGTSRLALDGVTGLGGGEFRFTEDFHEITTFLAIGAITGGEVSVKNSNPEQFPLIDRTFAKFGVRVTHKDGWSSAVTDGALRVRPPFTQYILPKVEAAPWPYLPVDLLPMFVALGVKAEGSMMFWNKVYEGAFGWTVELSKFGAHTLMCDPHRIVTFGGKPLTPASVESPYIIRVALALFMVAATIEGRSVITNATPIRRAHPRFVENLNSIGANVEWVRGEG